LRAGLLEAVSLGDEVRRSTASEMMPSTPADGYRTCRQEWVLDPG
jgi:hypothetical protein